MKKKSQTVFQHIEKQKNQSRDSSTENNLNTLNNSSTHFNFFAFTDIKNNQSPQKKNRYPTYKQSKNRQVLCDKSVQNSQIHIAHPTDIEISHDDMEIQFTESQNTGLFCNSMKISGFRSNQYSRNCKSTLSNKTF